jgi:CspA family cold shock protein
MKGTIKRKVDDKGFGFITPEGSDKDVFFHHTSLQGVDFNSLKEGDVVTFDVADSDKGPKAENVALAQ